MHEYPYREARAPSLVAVSPRGATGVSWRVRARQPLDSGRSLLLFLADPARS